MHRNLGSCGFQWCGFHLSLCIFKKVAQISSSCDFHYISKGIPSLMRFWLPCWLAEKIQLAQIFLFFVLPGWLRVDLEKTMHHFEKHVSAFCIHNTSSIIGVCTCSINTFCSGIKIKIILNIFFFFMSL